MRNCYTKNDLGKSFGLAVAMMLVAQVVLSLVFVGFTDAQTGSMPNWAFWTMQASYTLLIGSVALLYARLTNTDFFSATTANQKPKIKHILWGCVTTLFLIAAMLPINEWLLDLIEKLGFARPSVDIPLQIVPLVLIACILPAVTEEFVFRGTVAMSIAHNKNKLAGVVISGALFALFHMNPAQTLHQFVLGTFLTLLVFRSGSIWTSVVVHLFNNLVAVILTFTIKDDAILIQNGVLLAVVGLIGFALCLFGYIKTTSDSWRNSQQSDDMCAKTEIKSAVFLAISVLVCVLLWILTLVTK